MNALELEKLSRKTGRPILGIRSYDKKPGAEEKKGLKTELMDPDDFQGLVAQLNLSMGARVMMTHNEWVAAGLMNGAVGTVRGFVWGAGGDPHSTDPAKQAPVFVVVEFDDVDLGCEEVVNERCDVEVVPRDFFPGMDLGVDAEGKPRSRRCVPVSRYEAQAASGESVYRHQFPLTLAWAMTHWKAQGMTLARARVKLGAKTAKQAGIGFVAVTRVKHPRDLVFEDDLPEWDAFQDAQFSETFRSRCRFERRLRAKASHTLRKYGFCKADPWSERESRIAAELIRRLDAVGAKQRASLRFERDPYAWCWPGEEPKIESLLRGEVEKWARGDEARLCEGQEVAERLRSSAFTCCSGSTGLLVSAGTAPAVRQSEAARQGQCGHGGRRRAYDGWDLEG
jgi:hypothetical protein